MEPLGLTRDLLRDVLDSGTPGRLFALVQHGERLLVARFDRGGSAWEERTSEVAATELIRIPGRPGVFARTPLRPDRIVHIDDDLRSSDILLEPRVYGWTGADDALWYVTSPARGEVQLRRYAFAGGTDTLLRPLPLNLPRRRAGIGLLGGDLVLGTVLVDEADIGIVIDFR
jgi:hypothetical protein